MSGEDTPDAGGVIRMVVDNAPIAAPVDIDKGSMPGGRSPETDPPHTPTGRGGGSLPDDCPVKPLGRHGTTCFYLDALDQLVAFAPRDHSRLGLQTLFGASSHQLYEYWPRQKDGVVTGWRPELAAERLMQAAAEKGVWDPTEKIRGRGSWRGAEGELIWHCGDAIFQGAPPGVDEPPGARFGIHKPGLIGAHVYPAAGALPRPSAEPSAAGADGPAAEVLKLFETWTWRAPAIDPILLLGWCGAAMIGGALDWRPLVWITGGSLTGKSTLNKMLRAIFDDGLVAVTDATAAGIWQKLGYATLPVILDELEAEEDNRRSSMITKLARQASSGGIVLRGGQDHRGSEFTARSCFLFQSILIPPLLGQDRNRLAILELGRLPAGSRPPNLNERVKEIAGYGAALRRRLADGWHRLPETLEFYRASLEAAGHNARGMDQYGTLLACADLTLFDEMPESETADKWVAACSPSAFNSWDDGLSDEDHCLNHLMSSIVDQFRNGGRSTLGDWISKAAGRGGDGDPAEANRVLGTYGGKVLEYHGVQVLAIASSHQGLAKLFEGSQWQARAGASSVWTQALRRLPGAEPYDKTVNFAGARSKATIVPVELVLPDPEEGTGG